jgi:hypothetical protein
MARTALLVVDGLALIGVIAFSVLGALHPHDSVYVAGQIVCAALILATVYVLRRVKTNGGQE